MVSCFYIVYFVKNIVTPVQSPQSIITMISKSFDMHMTRDKLHKWIKDSVGTTNVNTNTSGNPRNSSVDTELDRHHNSRG